MMRVEFDEGRDGGPIAWIGKKASFAERGGLQPKPGETWEVEVIGQNLKGTVNFLRLLKKVDMGLYHDMVAVFNHLEYTCKLEAPTAADGAYLFPSEVVIWAVCEPLVEDGRITVESVGSGFGYHVEVSDEDKVVAMIRDEFQKLERDEELKNLSWKARVAYTKRLYPSKTK